MTDQKDEQLVALNLEVEELSANFLSLELLYLQATRKIDEQDKVLKDVNDLRKFIKELEPIVRRLFVFDPDMAV